MRERIEQGWTCAKNGPVLDSAGAQLDLYGRDVSRAVAGVAGLIFFRVRASHGGPAR